MTKKIDFKARLLAAAVVLASLAAFTGCGTTTEAGAVTDEAIPVVTESPVVEQIASTYTTKGTIRSKETGLVSPKIPGKVVRILVDEGDSVRKGQVVAGLDKTQLELNLKQAKQSLAQSKAGLAQAKAAVLQAAANQTKAQRDFERIERLYKQESVAKNKYDDAKTGKDVADASLDAARQAEELAEAQVQTAAVAIEIIETNLKDTNVIAPISGVITKKEVNIGEFIQPGMVIFTIETVDALELKADVPAKYLASVAPGSEVVAKIDGYNEQLSLVIDRISPSIDEKSRTAEITCVIGDDYNGLYPGQYATIDITLRKNEQALTVARDALLSDSASSWVFVVEEGKAHKAPVETGISQKNRVEILSGITSDASVVVVGQNNLTDGAKTRQPSKEEK